MVKQQATNRGQQVTNPKDPCYSRTIYKPEAGIVPDETLRLQIIKQEQEKAEENPYDVTINKNINQETKNFQRSNEEVEKQA